MELDATLAGPLRAHCGRGRGGGDREGLAACVFCSRDHQRLAAVLRYDVRERGAGAETDAAVAAVRASPKNRSFTTPPQDEAARARGSSSARRRQLVAGDRVLYALAKDESLLLEPVLAQFATGAERDSFQDIPSTVEYVFRTSALQSSRPGESSSSSRTTRTTTWP